MNPDMQLHIRIFGSVFMLLLIIVPVIACETQFFNKLGDALTAFAKCFSNTIAIWLSPKVILVTFAVAFASWQIYRLIDIYESKQTIMIEVFNRLTSIK